MSDHAYAKEPGTLIYEWTVSEDGFTGHFFERYADSQAALIHLATYNEKFVDRLMALVEPGQLTVYGKPNAALKQELAGANPIYMENAGGFAR